jgi:hypothetical protein
MTDLPSSKPADETRRPDAARLRVTTELELVIAGALLFGLLKVPALIDSWWLEARPHVAGDLRLAHFFAYYYLTLIAFTLIATFCVHIGARAYWVGLMGLRSVYPAGPDWTRMQGRGPMALRMLQQRIPALERATGGADDFCSLTFSFAFLIVLYLVVSVVWAAVIGAIVLLLKRTVLPDVNAFALGFGVAAVTLLPMSLAGLVDLKLKERLDPQGRLGRFVSLLLRGSYYISLGPVVFPLLLTFATRFRRRTFYPLLAIVGAAVVGAFLFRMLAAERSGPALESYLLYPARRTEHSLDYRLYGNLRPEGRSYYREPFIQSDIVTDPYVRLFLPYYPRRDNDLIAELCPDARPLPDEGLFPGAAEPAAEDLRIALDCLASMHDVTINGEPLQASRYHFYEDPASGAHGIVTHLSTAALPTGYNEIRVVRRASKADQGRPRQLERALYVIPFWR